MMVKQKSLLDALLPCLLTIVLSGCSYQDATFDGTVVDKSGNPVPEAVVRFQNTAIWARTDKTGSFRLSEKAGNHSNYITAWKDGYINGGVKIADQRRNLRIVLNLSPAGDNKNYTWESPHAGNAKSKSKRCENCHPVLFAEWKQSSHSSAAINPLFLSVFSGLDKRGKSTGGPGYRIDFPHAKGNCATCHIPAMALINPFNSTPARSQGISQDGVFCDMCHKIQGVSVDNTGGRPGILSMIFKRPGPGENIFFGQLDDVIAGPDTCNPLYRESVYCSPCHNGTFWNVLAYSEYSEWAASSYAKKNIQCQGCHMKLRSGPRRFAIESEGGLLRDASILSSHNFSGLNDPSFMRASITLSGRAEVDGNTLHIKVSVANEGAGHHFPTGSPMRNMILVVQAKDPSGAALPLVKGERIPEWGGVGSPDRGNYAGLPGKGFAKILSELVEYPGNRKMGRQFKKTVPAPYWRPTTVIADSRIPADGKDISEYQFKLPDKNTSITIDARLIYRRTFKTWGTLPDIKNNDLALGTLQTIMTRDNRSVDLRYALE